MRGTILGNKLRAQPGVLGLQAVGAVGRKALRSSLPRPSHSALAAKPQKRPWPGSAWGVGLLEAGVSSTSLESPHRLNPEREPEVH